MNKPIKNIILVIILIHFSVLSYGATVFEKTKQKAELGKPKAQYELAQMYFVGNGIERNVDEAILWYKKVAEQGNVEAQYKLADIYFTGNGIDKNYKEAFNYYKQSAEKGYKNSYFNLAELYYSGDNGEKNLQEALKWYLKTKEMNNPETQLKIGNIYKENGNKKQAFKWYEKSANQNNPEALYNVAEYYNAQHKSAKAIKFYEKAIELGNIDAILYFARNIQNANSDREKYYLKAIELGKKEATKELADYYYQEGNYEKAVGYYQKIYDNGDAYVLDNMAKSYEMIEDKNKAIVYYEKSFEQTKSDVASEALGKIYEQDSNYTKAIEWYEKSFDNGNDKIAITIANIYLDNLNNISKGKEWYKKLRENKLISEIISEQKNLQTARNCGMGYISSNYNNGEEIVEQIIKLKEKIERLATKPIQDKLKKGESISVYNAQDIADAIEQISVPYQVAVTFLAGYGDMEIGQFISACPFQILQIFPGEGFLMQVGDRGGLFYAQFSNTNKFRDGQFIYIRGQYKGNYSYTTIYGVRKTIPKVKAYVIMDWIKWQNTNKEFWIKNR